METTQFPGIDASLIEVPSRRRKYQFVRDRLIAEINAGRFAPGQPLPTEVSLAKSMGISRNTIRLALGQLQDEGMVERVQGRGTFVTTDSQTQVGGHIEAFALISDELRTGFYPSLVKGFENGCAKVHEQMLLGNSDNEVAKQGNLILQMIDKNVSGVAIVPVTTEPTPAFQIRQLHKHNIPVVFCHRAVKDISAPCVTWNGIEVGEMAGAALYESGHRHVAFLYPHQSELSDAYALGLHNVIVSGGGRLKYCCYGSDLPGSHAAGAIRKSLAETLLDDDRPTAVFCGSLPDAEQVYLLAPELGRRIPEDLSLIVFGGTQRDGALAQRISSVGVPEHEVGEYAAQLLAEMQAGQRPLNNDERVILPLTLLPGESLGPAPTT
jgi:GntR family transcriptional regulator, arabinose operon transcriptional repressor